MSKYKYHRKDQHQQLRCGHRRFGNKFWYADFWYSTKRKSKFWIYPHFSKSHFKIQLESDPWLGTTAAKRRIASQEHIADGVGHQLSWSPHPKSTTRKRETSVSKDPHEQATSRFFLRSQTIRSHRLPPPTSPLLRVSTYIGGALLQCASPLLLSPIPGILVSQSPQLGSRCRSSGSTQVS